MPVKLESLACRVEVAFLRISLLAESESLAFGVGVACLQCQIYQGDKRLVTVMTAKGIPVSSRVCRGDSAGLPELATCRACIWAVTTLR